MNKKRLLDTAEKLEQRQQTCYHGNTAWKHIKFHLLHINAKIQWENEQNTSHSSNLIS